MCDVDIDGVISTPDAPSIYDIPKVLHREELDAYVVRRLDLPFRDVDWTRVGRPAAPGARAARRPCESRWSASTSTCPTPTCRWPRRCAPAGSRTAPRWRSAGCRPTTARPTAARPRRSTTSHGVLIPGGFGIRGIEGKIGAIRYARQRGIPVLGLCLGLQCIVIEAARSVGLDRANSAEFDPDTPDPVISTMADQRDVVAGEADLGGTMRLGAYPGDAGAGIRSSPRRIRSTQVSERHRHRYEVNNAYRDRIAESGLRFSGTSPDGHLVEFVELPARGAPVPASARRPTRSSRAGRPGRIRCSSRSSARRSSTRRPSGCRWRSPSSTPTAASIRDDADSRCRDTSGAVARG